MTEPQLSVDEALRVVGHLLEHHPTTKAAARDVRGEAVGVGDRGASCYCLTGALMLVQYEFKVASDLLEAASELLIESPSALKGSVGLMWLWDCNPEWRLEAVEKLKRAGLSTRA